MIWPGTLSVHVAHASLPLSRLPHRVGGHWAARSTPEVRCNCLILTVLCFHTIFPPRLIQSGKRCSGRVLTRTALPSFPICHRTPLHKWLTDSADAQDRGPPFVIKALPFSFIQSDFSTRIQCAKNSINVPTALKSPHCSCDEDKAFVRSKMCAIYILKSQCYCSQSQSNKPSSTNGRGKGMV